MEEKSVALELETRRRIFEFVSTVPGAHLREIQRGLEMPMGLLEYHLGYLEKSELVAVKADKYYKRYYPARMGAQERVLLSALRQKPYRAVVIYLLQAPGPTHRAMVEALDLSPSTLSFYLKDLIEKGVVRREKAGRESIYTVEKPEEVVRALIAYKPGFLDVLVDRFLEAWFEKGGGGGHPM